jgi:hypothetical protein
MKKFIEQDKKYISKSYCDNISNLSTLSDGNKYKFFIDKECNIVVSTIYELISWGDVLLGTNVYYVKYVRSMNREAKFNFS